jgi:hypothetical protein
MKNALPTFDKVTLCSIILGGALLMVGCEKSSEPVKPLPAQSSEEARQVIELALTLDPKTGSNMLNGAEAIPKLVKSGVFPEKPLTRMDYSDYYAPKANIQVLGSQLVFFAYEYFDKYVGCCVNPGNAIVLIMGSDTTHIENFAKLNKCDITKGNEILFPDALFKMKAITEEMEPKLIEVSCKENYRILHKEKSK